MKDEQKILVELRKEEGRVKKTTQEDEERRKKRKMWKGLRKRDARGDERRS